MSILFQFVFYLTLLKLVHLQSYNLTTTTSGEELNTTSTTRLVTTSSSLSPSSTTTTTSTSSSAAANIFQTKTICTCLMDYLDDSVIISCPVNFKINVATAFIYDIGNNNCTKTTDINSAGGSQHVMPFKDELAGLCTGTNCTITESFIINSVDPSNFDNQIICLTVDIKWFCYQFTTTYSVVSAPSTTYGFTYFFYIITLVISSSCILIGAIFILRRFLIIRRHGPGSPAPNSRSATRRHHHHHHHHNQYCENAANGGVWACSYGPPAYDHIYESSMPINPPPEYDAATLAASNLKFQYLKSEDQVLFVYENNNNNQQQQQQQTTSMLQELNEQQAATTDVMSNQNNETMPSTTTSPPIDERDLGETNLAFKIDTTNELDSNNNKNNQTDSNDILKAIINDENSSNNNNNSSPDHQKSLIS